MLLYKTAKILDIELGGIIRLCSGCAVVKGFRYPLRAKTRLECDSMNLAGPESVATGEGKLLCSEKDYPDSL